MNSPSVAIIKSDFHGKHSTSWSNVWLQYCVEMGVSHSLIDWRELDAFTQLAQYNIVLWHFSHYSRDEMHFARSILKGLKAAGCRVFPDSGDSDHFDDKLAQAYLLNGLGINTPINYILHSEVSVNQWIDEIGTFPIVAKLRTGSGAANVQLIHDADALKHYTKQMFGPGLASKPSALFKVKSNILSTQSFGQLFRRLRRTPEFLFSLQQAKQLPRESGYVYLQEFIPGVDYDLKVVVVGDYLSFVARRVRGRDFRASGGGELFYDRTLVDKEIINLAFRAADALSSDCTGFDIIKDPRTGRAVILEVSYGFSHSAQTDLGGCYDRQGNWHDKPLNAPRALLDNIIQELSQK